MVSSTLEWKKRDCGARVVEKFYKSYIARSQRGEAGTVLLYDIGVEEKGVLPASALRGPG